MLKAPSAPTVPVPITVPAASRTCTVAPGSPRPVKVTPSARARSVGCAGPTRSGDATLAAGEMLPAASVRVTWRLLPSLTAGSRLTVKVPSAPTVPVASRLPAASRTCTVVPASPRPVSWLPASPMTKFTGASGGVTSPPPSMSGAVTALAWDMLPAASAAVACSTSPSTWAGFKVMLNTPVAPTTAEPNSVPSAARIRTVLPGSARPVTTVPSALTASSVGAVGAVISGAVTWAGSDDTSSAMATTSSSSPLA